MVRAATSARTALTVGALALICRPGIGRSPDLSDLNPMQLQADYVTISVAHLASEVAWYDSVLGFREEGRHETTERAATRLSTGGAYDLELVWRKGSKRPRETGYLRQGWMHVVFTTPAIDAAYQRLRKLGTRVYAGYNSQGRIWRIYLHDPEGNEIEIVARSGETLGVLDMPPTVPVMLPPGPNRALVIRTCTVCHSAATIAAARLTHADWERTIARMVALGAAATPKQQMLILDYLKRNFERQLGAAGAPRPLRDQTRDPGALNPMRLQYDHITISVARFDQEVGWYERVLGVRENLFHPGKDMEVIHLSMGGTYHLDLAWQKGSVRSSEAGDLRQGWVRPVFTTPAIEAAYRRLKKLGANAHADYDAQRRLWRIVLRDPESNEIYILARPGAAIRVMNGPPSVPASVLPAGANRALVIFTCTVCHSAQTIAATRRTKADWERMISRMVSLGAVASPDDRMLILHYLDRSFGWPPAQNGPSDAQRRAN